MKKFGIFLLFIFSITLIAVLMYFQKSENTKPKVTVLKIDENFDEVTKDIKDAIKKADPDKVSEAVDFIKEKTDEGAFKSKEGINKTIVELQEKYDIEIPDDKKDEVVDAIDKLEDLGFSTDKLAKETTKLYDEYGVDFVDHMEEAFVEAAKDTAQNIAKKTWDNITQSVKDTISSIAK